MTVVIVHGAPTAGLLCTDIVVKNASCALVCLPMPTGSANTPAGSVGAGDSITCSNADGDGPFYVTYKQTNTLLYTANF